MSAPLLDIVGLQIALGSRDVIRNLSLSVEAGEFIALVGPNGAGKTSILRALAGILRARGAIRFRGNNLREMPAPQRARHIAYLPQGGQLYWPMPVRDVVALGRIPFARAGALITEDRDIIAQAMRDCDLDHMADDVATRISGGERARVLLARMLAVRAELLLVDEPVASLDPAQQIAAMGLLRREADAGHAVIAVLHDLSLALRFASRVVVLVEGRIVADATPAKLAADPALGQAFGVQFSTAMTAAGLVLAPMPRETGGEKT